MNSIEKKIDEKFFDYINVLYDLPIDYYNLKIKIRFEIQEDINEKIRKSYFNSLPLH
jgi:hypothetical protein